MTDISLLNAPLSEDRLAALAKIIAEEKDKVDCGHLQVRCSCCAAEGSSEI